MNFGDFELALDRYELRLRGRPVKVEPRVLEVLAYLVEHQQRIVSKDELLETLWQGACVSDAALTRAIGQARRILKDDSESGYSIQTIYGRGFRFVIGDERALEALPAIESDTTETEPTMAAASPPLPAPAVTSPQAPPGIATVQAIAVLPFEDMSQEQNQRHFCDGLVEELITALSVLPHLRVVARTSSFSYRDRPADARTIGRELEVDGLVEGSVRTDGDTFRITIQLVDTVSGCLLWCQRFDQPPVEISALQEKIARSVVRVMRAPIDSQVPTTATAGPSTVIEAYEAYLKGRELFRYSTISSLGCARKSFRQAATIDPAYALAFAGVADSSSFLFFFGGRNDEDRRQADEASRRALELGPDLALVHASRATALWVLNQYDEAETAFLTARRLDTSLFEVEYYFGRFNLARGQFENAVESLQRALEIRPSSLESALSLAMALRALGQEAPAKRFLRQAIASAKIQLKHYPEDLRTLAISAVPLLYEGRLQEALSNLARCLAENDGDPVILYNVACGYAVAGRPAQSLSVLARAVDEGFSDWHWMSNDADLESIRQQTEFQQLVGRARAQSSSRT